MASKAFGATPKTDCTLTVAYHANTSTFTWPKFAIASTIVGKTSNPCCTSF